MTTEEALSMLVAADPERSYCVQTDAWANVPLMSDMPHGRSDKYSVFVIPRISENECVFQGDTISEATHKALHAVIRNKPTIAA